MIEINPQKIDYTQRKSIEEKNPRKLVKNVSRSGELIFRGGLALQAELGTQMLRGLQDFYKHHKVRHLLYNKQYYKLKTQNQAQEFINRQHR